MDLNKIIIFNDKKYRIFSDEKNDYIVDLSINKSSCLFGIPVWFFPVFGYVIKGEQITFKKKQTNLFFSIILYLGIIYFLIISSEVLKDISIVISKNQKISICIIIFFLSWLCKIVNGKIDQKKFYSHNAITEKDIIKMKISFKSKWCVIKIFLISFLCNFFIFGGIVSIFIAVPRMESIFPFVIISIFMFIFSGEKIKTPFLQTDIKEIKILEGKRLY